MILPFVLGEVTYWLPIFAFGFVCLFKPILWIPWTAFWGFYVGVLPAIPLQIACMGFYKVILTKIKRRLNRGQTEFNAKTNSASIK
jgi:hypothetical protein